MICNLKTIFLICVLGGMSGIKLLAQPPAGKAWKMTFNDEFTTPTLNPEKWDFGFGWGTNSGAFSEVNRPENVFIENGDLVIRVDTMPNKAGWWSGAVNTKKHFGEKRGYFEARIKVAKGNGFDNGFWAKPLSEQWPPEIDFVEVLGKGSTKAATFTIHYNYPNHSSSGSDWISPVDLSLDYHVYGFEWTEKDFVWYVDGIERRRSTEGFSDIEKQNEAFYMMLNVHVMCKDAGCQAWTGVPDATNLWPAYMRVDWVRVWQPDTSLNTSITNIKNGDIILPGTITEIEASARNGNEKIQQVEFIINDEKYGADSISPYSIPFRPEFNGRFKAQSVVYDTSNRFNKSRVVYFTFGNPPQNNLLFNGDFNEGTQNWKLDLQKSAIALYSLDSSSLPSGNYTALVDITEGTSDMANIAFWQPVHLVAGKKYELKFIARAASDRKIKTEIISTEISLSYLSSVINLTPSQQKISKIFTATRTDLSSILRFNLGGTNADVWMDSIYLMEVVPNDISIRDSEGGYSLYPNPACDFLLLTVDPAIHSLAKWRIMDQTGRELIRGNTEQLRIDIQSLNPGIYLFEFQSINKGLDIIKFVKANSNGR